MNFNIYNLHKNDSLTNILIFLTIALTIGYISKQNYNALIFLYVVAILLIVITKNLALSLGISIIFTNLVLSMNILNSVENFEDKKDEKKEKKEKTD